MNQILYNDTDQNSVNNCLSDYGYINFVCKSINPNEKKYFAQQIFFSIIVFLVNALKPMLLHRSYQ